jgi:leucyl/phenylalanyl-tRNA--protein transferase
MTIYRLIDEIIFPPVDEAEEDGLLAVGGDLSP